MKGKYRIAVAAAIVLGLALLFGWLLSTAHIDVLSPKGTIAAQQKDLMLFTVVLSAIVVVPVFVLLAVFAFKYRDTNPKHKGYDPEWKENSKLEAIWWGIPMVIIGILAVVTWYTSHSLDPYKKIQADHPSMPVQVVALQWKWLFLYPEQGVATVNYVVMPKDVPVTFYLTADAPMSAFWIPSLGSQIYNMNGMTSELNLLATQNGEYKGYSTNINGRGYADMTFTANVIDRDDFNAWTDGVRSSPRMQLLDNAQLARLQVPSVEKSAITYRLDNSGLYHEIVGKYMPNMMHEMSDEATMDSMSDMEGHH